VNHLDKIFIATVFKDLIWQTILFKYYFNLLTGVKMYQIKDTFQCKPGKAKELVKKFKQTIPFMEEQNFKNIKIMTDVVSNYWTVVLEGEVESLAAFENHKGFTSQEKVKEIMAGYMDLVEGGKREIFQIE